MITIDKATATEYSFVIGKIPGSDGIHSTDEVKLNIFNVEIPSVSLDSTTLFWNGKHIQVHPGGITFDTLNISFTVDADFNNWKALFRWLTSITNNKDTPTEIFSEYLTDASIQIYDNFGEITNTIMFKNVWISSIGQVSFNIREGETYIECSATFNYDRYEIL